MPDINSTHLHKIGRNPAYSSRSPPSRARRVNPVTSPVAYLRSDTRRIRVASSGVSKISAKNLILCQRWIAYRLVDNVLCYRCSPQINGGTVPHRYILVSGDFDEFLLPVFITGKFGASLGEIADSCGAKPSQEAFGTFRGYYMACPRYK